jgi:hypothetical protein
MSESRFVSDDRLSHASAVADRQPRFRQLDGCTLSEYPTVILPASLVARALVTILIIVIIVFIMAEDSEIKTVKIALENYDPIS